MHAGARTGAAVPGAPWFTGDEFMFSMEYAVFSARQTTRMFAPFRVPAVVRFVRDSSIDRPSRWTIETGGALRMDPPRSLAGPEVNRL